MTVITSTKTKCTEYIGPHKANKKPGGLSKRGPVDAYVKYAYKKKKLNVHLGVVAKQQNESRAALEESPRISFKKKISLVFLSQGLRSDEIAKMRALLGMFSINIRMVPLRL